MSHKNIKLPLVEKYRPKNFNDLLFDDFLPAALFHLDHAGRDDDDDDVIINNNVNNLDIDDEDDVDIRNLFHAAPAAAAAAAARPRNINRTNNRINIGGPSYVPYVADAPLFRLVDDDDDDDAPMPIQRLGAQPPPPQQLLLLENLMMLQLSTYTIIDYIFISQQLEFMHETCRAWS